MSSIYTVRWKTKAGGERTGWRVQYLVAGKKRQRQFTNERAAKRFADTTSTVTERELRALKTGRSPRLDQIAAEWLAACRRGRDGALPLEHHTIAWYAGHVRNWIDPALGQTRAQALTVGDVKEFRDALLEKEISRRTAKKILVTLKTLIGYAIEQGYLSSDPSARVGIRLSRRDQHEVQIHSRAEMKAIFDAADRLRTSPNAQTSRTWQRYWPLLHLLVYAGLRLSEARGLERDAVDTRAGTIHVRQRADQRGVIGAPKSAKGNRRIHIPDNSAAAIRDWLPSHPHPFVFATGTGRPIDGNNIRKRLWDVVQVEAGVRVLTLHSARHFFASREIERGTHLKELCDLMGHADEAFTLRTYGHLFRDHESERKRKQSANERELV